MVSIVDGDNKSTLNLATRVESFAGQATTPAILQALSERMMGLEPSTFCMARASDVRARSRPFAQTACLQRVRQCERTRANPNERPTLPFLPRLLRRQDVTTQVHRGGRIWTLFPDHVVYRVDEICRLK
jgi:hypothetical protein